MKKLEPCPFCRSKNLYISSLIGSHYVMCLDCNCNGPEEVTCDKAIESWNRRSYYEEINCRESRPAYCCPCQR